MICLWAVFSSWNQEVTLLYFLLKAIKSCLAYLGVRSIWNLWWWDTELELDFLTPRLAYCSLHLFSPFQCHLWPCQVCVYVCNSLWVSHVFNVCNWLSLCWFYSILITILGNFFLPPLFHLFLSFLLLPFLLPSFLLSALLYVWFPDNKTPNVFILCLKFHELYQVHLYNNNAKQDMIHSHHPWKCPYTPLQSEPLTLLNS